MAAAQYSSSEALREALKGKTPGEILKALRETLSYSRSEFADYIRRQLSKAQKKPIRTWSENTIKALESVNPTTGLNITPWTPNELEDLNNANVIRDVSYPEVWRNAFDDALKLQAARVPSSVPPAQAQPPTQLPPADLPKTPTELKIGVGGGQSQEVRMPYETPSDKKPTSVPRKEPDQGTNSVKPTYTRWLPLAVLLLIVALGGSCALGGWFYKLLMDRGFSPAKQVATFTTTTTLPTSERQVVYGVVTATPSPATVASPQPTATAQVVTRVVTTRAEVVYKVITATPESATETSQPTNTSYPTSVPTVTPTTKPAVTLPFEDNFDKGLKPEWKVILGTWRMESGFIRADDNDKSAIVVGDSKWNDYAVTADLIGSCGKILIRWSPDVFIQVDKVYDEGSIYLVEKGEYKLLSRRGLPSGAKVRVEARGDIFSVFINEQLALQTQDKSAKTGLAGLAGRCAFDNFRVASLQ